MLRIQLQEWVYFLPKELAIMHVYWLLSDSCCVGGDVLKWNVLLLCKVAYFFQDTPTHWCNPAEQCKFCYVRVRVRVCVRVCVCVCVWGWKKDKSAHKRCIFLGHGACLHTSLLWPLCQKHKNDPLSTGPGAWLFLISGHSVAELASCLASWQLSG